MLAVWVCWKEKGSDYGVEIALFWLFWRFDSWDFK